MLVSTTVASTLSLRPFSTLLRFACSSSRRLICSNNRCRTIVLRKAAGRVLRRDRRSQKPQCDHDRAPRRVLPLRQTREKRAQ